MKLRIFFFLKKERPSSLNDRTIWSRNLLRMCARDSVPEVWVTLSADEVMHAQFINTYRRSRNCNTISAASEKSVHLFHSVCNKEFYQCP